MITSALLSFVDTVAAFFLNGLPDSPVWVESFGVGGSAMLQGILDGAAKWGFIVPFETIGPVFQIAIGSFVVAISVKVVRIVLSYVTLGGGM